MPCVLSAWRKCMVMVVHDLLRSRERMLFGLQRLASRESSTSQACIYNRLRALYFLQVTPITPPLHTLQALRSQSTRQCLPGPRVSLQQTCLVATALPSAWSYHSQLAADSACVVNNRAASRQEKGRMDLIRLHVGTFSQNVLAATGVAGH